MRTIIRYSLLTAALTLLLWCAPARAEESGGHVNPYANEIYAHSRVDSEEETVSTGSMRNLLRAAKSANYLTALTALSEEPPVLTFTLKCITQPELGSAGKWRMDCSDTETAYDYEFYFGEWKSEDFGSYWAVHVQRKSADNVYIGCDVVVPGDYRLMVNIYDASGKRVKQSSYRYQFESTADYPSLDTICSQIVSEVRGSTAYHTALNLYDWITQHMHYDNTHEYYGADGALVRGYGVCDSYSKAYYLLLRSANIPVARVVGSANSGEKHAWNMLYLDGNWYQADATWDDPGATLQPTSGRESHEYFCITDELMLQSGHEYTPSAATPCTSLAMNYYVMTPGSWDSWSKTNFTQVETPVLAGANSFAVYAGSETRRHLSILAWIYTHQPEWTAERRGDATWQYFFNVDNGTLALAVMDGRETEGVWLYEPGEESATLAGYLGLDGTLAVPDTLGELPVAAVADNAFLGDSRLRDVNLPEGVLSIGEGAFADCVGLEEIVLPQSLASIGAYAFRGDVWLAAPAMPDTVSDIGQEAFPEGMLFTCGQETPLALALSRAACGFLDAEDPAWRLIWLTDTEPAELAVLAAPQGQALVTLPGKVQAVLSLGEAEPTALAVPETLAWFSDEMTLPASLCYVITSSDAAMARTWAEAHALPALLTDRQTTLPGSLTALEEEALSGVPVHWLVLPAGVTSVGENALACDGLAAVTLLGGDLALDAAAFGDQSPVLFAPAGSAAAAHARSQGFTVLEP